MPQAPDPPLDAPVEQWLVRGGDHRLLPDPATGLSPYRVAPRPRPSLPFGSCTATSPSPAGMDAARAVLDAVRADPSSVRAAVEDHRRRLAALFDLPADAALAFTPSGTDAVYLLSAITLRGAARIHHVVVGASELGSATLAAARGLAISEVAPFGSATRHAPLPGLAPRCSAEPVYLRDELGARHEDRDVDAGIAARVRAAPRDARIVLHLVAHSKTGLRAPSAELCRALQHELGDRLVVVVDAAQGRLAPRDVRRAVEFGFAVLFTGSKFYSGPPFSGSLILPARLAADPGPLPDALGDWFSRAELPPTWERARASLPRPHNLGLALRWAAALAEMEAYHAIPTRLRAGSYHTFAGAVYEVFGPSEVLAIDAPHPPVHQLTTALGAYPSVFGFRVLGPDGPLDVAALRELHAAVDTATAGAPPIHLGQPVALGPPARGGPALLRVALGARLVIAHAPTPDHGAAFFREALGEVRARIESRVRR